MLQCCTVGVNWTLHMPVNLLQSKVKGQLEEIIWHSQLHCSPDEACRIIHRDKLLTDHIQLLQAVRMLRICDVS